MARNRFDIDEDLERPFNMKQFLRLMGYMKPFKKEVLASITLMIVAAICGIASPYLTKVAIDDSILKGDFKKLVIVCSILLVTIAVNAICLRSRIIIMSKTAQKIIFNIRKDLFDHIQSLSFSYFDNRPAGKILVRVVNYVNSLNELFQGGLINLITDVFTIFAIILVMFSINIKLSLISLSILPVLFLLILSTKSVVRRRWQNHSRKTSNMNAYLHESICGVRITQAYVQEKENDKVFCRLNDNIYSTWMSALRVHFTIWPIIEIPAAIGAILIYIFGIQMLDSGEVTVGILVAFTGYIGRFWQPISNIANVYSQMLVAMSSTERIFETMDEPMEIFDLEGSVEMPDINGDIEFDNVSFQYEEGKAVLTDVNFKVSAGETIALVGPTGAGKTTIVNLICRFYDPEKGKILIDGQDIKHAKLGSLRKQMGVMMQDSFIFSGTIMDNIRYSKPGAADEEVVEAAKAVEAHDFIMQMEKGYQTEVNERGSRLSIGQRQLISFARAILANPKILILDEATSSIDTKTEKVIQDALQKLLKGRTSFVIAHRLSTIRYADKIMYIDEGGIAESGSHNELMDLKGKFYNLYCAQYKFLEAV